MPIASPGASVVDVVAGVPLNPDEEFELGAALSMVDGEFVLASSSNAANFFGFYAGLSRNDPIVYTKRGSFFAPLVVGGDDLIIDQPCYLSTTPGRVTQSVPNIGTILQVGVARDANRMTLQSDGGIKIP